MAYIPRALESRVREALASMPAVFLNGPRQAGKSTLAQHLARGADNSNYLTFDDAATLSAALSDAKGFLQSLQTPVTLDEVQRAPPLFRVLKEIIDGNRLSDGRNANGRFLLTGSANVLALPGLSDALVGRMSVLTLYPLSAGEALGRPSPVINGLFDQELPSQVKHGGRRVQFSEIVQRATFPSVSGVSQREMALWFDGYVNTLLQRDVRQLSEVENIAALPNIVKVLAARVSGLLNDADSARDAKLNTMTYRRYRALVQQLFLIGLVPAWSRNIGKRLVKSPKLYFCDTALLCHLLGTDASRLERTNPGLFGRVLENFAASELIKQIAMISNVALFHFRSHDGHEVDFVLERRDGRLIGIEVKSAASVTIDDFSGLKTLKQQIGPDFLRGIVLYRGSNALSFGEGMVALPIEYLWSLDVSVTTDEDIRCAGRMEGYVFWANYGERTRVRCLISRETVDGYFSDGGSDEQSLAAIRKNWHVIWPIIVRKITDGQIEIVRHDHGSGMIAGRYQDIRRTTLEPSDFGFQDFRKHT